MNLRAEQKQWLRDVLRQTDQAGHQAIVFAHKPVNVSPYVNPELVEILESAGCVFAFFAGHHHPGEYSVENGIHYVTMQGMVETPENNAYAVVHLFDDHVAIEGVGNVPSRTLDRQDISERSPDRKRIIQLCNNNLWPQQ